DGTLTPRGTAGAMIEDETKAVQQAIGMVEHGTVATVGGGSFPLRPGTICLHGDQPGALRFANALRAALQQHGSRVKAP
ncbi:MAG: LamB/YcsF family protein, partial [Rhodoferax sp.]|nr:LamB/YcsF family protein [Rhodoferax sp.]